MPAHPLDPHSALGLDCGPSGRIALELVAGNAGLTRAVRCRRLWTCFPLDFSELDLIRPEIQELVLEAGFKKVTVYWEGEDEDGEGNGEYEPTTEGTADPAYVSYIVAEK